MQKLKLTDLIDVEVLQSLQDGFSKFTGMSSLTTDDAGIPVTRESGFCDFCKNIVRQSELGVRRCNECDQRGALESAKTGKPAVYRCHAGIVDFAAPIMVEGRVLGSFLGGQIRSGELDEEKLKKIAAELSLDPDTYLEAARKVPVIEKDIIDRSAEFLAELAKVLSNMAYQNYITLQQSKRMERAARSQASYMMTLATGLREDMEKWMPLTEKALESDDLEELKESVRELKKMGTDTLTDVGEALDYIKLASGEVTLSETEYDVGQLLESVISNVKTEAERRNVEIEVILQKDMPRAFMGDSGRIGMLLSRVLQKIVSHTEEKMLIEISSKKNSYSTILVFGLKEMGEHLSQDIVDGIKEQMKTGEGMESSISELLMQQLNGTFDITYEKENEVMIQISLPQLATGGDGDGI